MKFRTEIEKIIGSFEITHESKIFMLGSCFADNIGELLVRDGFNVVHNPLGPLYNPESIYRFILRGPRPYSIDELYLSNGIYHCMDYASRYQDSDPSKLLEKVNSDFLGAYNFLNEADILIITYGTNKVFRHREQTVGNCHKLPGNEFTEHSLSCAEITNFPDIISSKKVILTLSPVRYPGEGLAKGNLAKATLRVAINEICQRHGYDYFPAFEIVNDDLRDYRFYAPDMRHPSETAVEYIYNIFRETYFPKDTQIKANDCRMEYLRNAHRPIINTR